MNAFTPLQPRGVLLIGHGTRDAAGTQEFFSLAERVAEELAADAVVRPCLLEFQKPDIAEAWASLMQARCTEIVVAPLLLFAAGHAKSDIPGEVDAARASTPSNDPITVSYAKPITRHPAMIAAVRERLRRSLQRTESDGPDSSTVVVMVGRGSRDVCATTDMRVLSETAIRGRVEGVSIADELRISPLGLSTTFYAMAEPRLPATLDEVARSGHFSRIIVHPHLLFSGRLYDAIVEQVATVAAEHPSIRFEISDYLGPTSAVAAAIAGRIRQTSSLR